MGRMKDHQMKLAEPVIAKIDQILDLIEEEIALHGKADRRTSDELAVAISKYAAIFPMDDLRWVGSKMIESTTNGLIRYKDDGGTVITLTPTGR
jgi:hypothetical protein